MLVAALAVADDYDAARAKLVSAFQDADYPAMVAAAERIRDIQPHDPRAWFNLAFARTLNENNDGALVALEQLLNLQRDFAVLEQPAFQPLHADSRWSALAERIDALYEPTGKAGIVAELDEAKFVPEGIAVDSNGHLYLGSIHKGKLVRVGDSVEVLSDRQGHWSVFGMRFDPEGQLWFASAAIPQFGGDQADEGRTGLFRLDVSNGEITRAALLPQHAEKQLLGDLVFVSGDIYTTDSLTGAVYRYDVSNNLFATLVAPGIFRSPQGLVADASGKFLYVADYTSGLHRVSLADGRHTRLSLPPNLTDYGIDGLYRHGDELIAIQNGQAPHRVVALRVAEDGLSITDSRIIAANLESFDEPTLGTIVGQEFWFVANSHWNRFDEHSQLPEGLSGPIVLKVRLASQY